MAFMIWKEDYRDLLLEGWEDSGRQQGFDAYCVNVWEERGDDDL